VQTTLKQIEKSEQIEILKEKIKEEKFLPKKRIRVDFRKRPVKIEDAPVQEDDEREKIP